MRPRVFVCACLCVRACARKRVCARGGGVGSSTCVTKRYNNTTTSTRRTLGGRRRPRRRQLQQPRLLRGAGPSLALSASAFGPQGPLAHLPTAVMARVCRPVALVQVVSAAAALAAAVAAAVVVHPAAGLHPLPLTALMSPGTCGRRSSFGGTYGVCRRACAARPAHPFARVRA
jgi:hypothetical protein